MTTQSSDKIQEFQDAGAAIIGALAEAKLKPAEEGLQHVFAIAHDEGTQRKQIDLVQQVWNGVVDISQLSIRVGGAEAVRLTDDIREQKAKQGRDTQMLLAMLDDMDRIAAELADLRDAADESWASFSERYGGREGILETFFTEEEREGLETNEDIQRALVEKFLNEDGSLKPGAADVLNPQDIEELRDWQKLQQTEREFADLGAKIEDNGGQIKPEHREYIDERVREASLDEVLQMAQGADGTALEDAVIEADNDAKIELAQDIGSGGFTL